MCKKKVLFICLITCVIYTIALWICKCILSVHQSMLAGICHHNICTYAEPLSNFLSHAHAPSIKSNSKDCTRQITVVQGSTWKSIGDLKTMWLRAFYPQDDTSGLFICRFNGHLYTLRTFFMVRKPSTVPVIVTGIQFSARRILCHPQVLPIYSIDFDLCLLKYMTS